ncbi:HEAT repeat domain-containing protein [Archangium sp.]|uniref:HEAT repeat domain-containing protein n=1 Tax=Archangium sp. TaxID=1872627 RepID=UPI002D6AF64C|nr:HEAT repeat domain-containing protein [Archangium sp.]HYO57290.1 HEAT repeat domain-containing protein [Archangium sp.]
MDVSRIRDDLVRAVKQGDENRARILVFQLGTGPKQIRAVLEAMLEDSDSLVRQAAAFGLGALGGAASAKRLEQQLALEEARGDYDGDAVIADIVRALSHIEEAGARKSLVRRLERLATRKMERSDAYEMAYALWRKRHPDLLPAVRQSLETLSLPAPHGLHGLLLLLEKTPEELNAWAQDPAVPMNYKTEVLAVLQEEVPDALISVLPAFISMAEPLSEETLSQDRHSADYCECLLRLLLMDRERLLSALPEHARSVLRSVARRLISATFPNPSTSAAVILEAIGRPEDAAFLEAHCPEYPTLAKVFLEAAQTLRNLH